jgi:hypothetical protein
MVPPLLLERKRCPLACATPHEPSCGRAPFGLKVDAVQGRLQDAMVSGAAAGLGAGGPLDRLWCDSGAPRPQAPRHRLDHSADVRLAKGRGQRLWRLRLRGC